jgi:hypothetical protein
MTDDPGFPSDEPLIDVRSPGERWADSGRAGYERLHASIRAQPLGALAMCWLLAVIVTVATGVYANLHLYGSLDNGVFGGVWIKLQTLSESGGLSAAVATLVGLALGVLAGRSRAGIAYQLALVLGAWIVFAAACGLVTAVHGYPHSIFTNADNRLVFGVQSVASLALGIVVLTIAWGFATSPRADGADEFEEPDEPDEPEVVELS